VVAEAFPNVAAPRRRFREECTLHSRMVVGTGKTVLQSSDNLAGVEGLCHHVAVLRDRRLIAQNDIAAVRE
jgi:ABC-type uncharacterized transport system ATPase subunit